MRSWRRPALIGLFLLGVAVRPGVSSWNNPVTGQWPDIVGETFPGGLLCGDQPALWFLQRIQAVPGVVQSSGPNPILPEQVWAAAEHFKTHRFAWKKEGGVVVAMTPNEAWANALIAARLVEHAATIPPPTQGMQSPPPDHPWTKAWEACKKRLDTELSVPDAEWAATVGPNPQNSARHYILAISLSANHPPPWGADPFELDRINENLARIKLLPDDEVKNPIRWAYLVSANYAAQAADWELCRSELEQCN